MSKLVKIELPYSNIFLISAIKFFKIHEFFIKLKISKFLKSYIVNLYSNSVFFILHFLSETSVKKFMYEMKGHF